VPPSGVRISSFARAIAYFTLAVLTFDAGRVGREILIATATGCPPAFASRGRC